MRWPTLLCVQRSILPPDLAKGARDDPEEYARKAKFFGLKTPREGAECQVWLTAAQGEATSGDGKGAPGRSAPPGLIFTEPGASHERCAAALPLCYCVLSGCWG